MKLVDLLSRDRIVVPLKAATLVDAASELVNALIASGAVPQPDRADQLLDADSLPKDVVPIGPEAFMPLPHRRRLEHRRRPGRVAAAGVPGA